MEMALKLASIFFTMILVDNYVLAKFLGICPFLGVSKKLDSAVGMSLAVTFVMVVARGVYLPLITTNCTILGVTILNIDNGYNFMESIVCAAGAGIGFLVAMVLFSGVRRRVEQAVTPACFKGLPITLVAAAMTSLSFMGFGGIVEAIFRV